jgi:cyclopropane-fatty-acyl-phospholipid synthase
VVSVEMFEHMRNYAALLAPDLRLAAPGGVAVRPRLRAPPLRVSSSRTAGPTDWMAREFFTGGLMPSTSSCCHSLPGRSAGLEERGTSTARHYARTAEAWLANLMPAQDRGDGAVRR